MVEEILNRLPTGDLLFRSRFINQEWRKMASSICRRRHTPFYFENKFKFEDLVSRFQNADSIPWSYCEINVIGRDGDIQLELFSPKKNYKRLSSEESIHFMALFGEQLRGLKLSGNGVTYHSIITILQSTPHLEQISLGEIKKGLSTRVEFSGSSTLLNLRKLKHVKLNCYDPVPGLQFLEFLTTHPGIHLDSIELHFILDYGFGSYVDTAMFHTRQIPTVSFCFSYDSHDQRMDVFHHLLDKDDICIRGLKVCFQDPNSRRHHGGDFFHPIEKFLSNKRISDTLQRLSIKHWEHPQLHHNRTMGHLRLHIPNLPVLKYFKIDNMFSKHPQLISPLGIKHFPTIKPLNFCDKHKTWVKNTPDSISLPTLTDLRFQGGEIFQGQEIDTGRFVPKSTTLIRRLGHPGGIPNCSLHWNIETRGFEPDYNWCE